MTPPPLRLTEIQKLLNGQRGRREPGVVLDFGVGVFQERHEDPHFWGKSFNDDARMRPRG